MPQFEIHVPTSVSIFERTHTVEGDFFYEENGTLTIQKGEESPVAIFAPGQWTCCKKVAE